MFRTITLDVLVSPGCHMCRVFEEYWETVASGWPNIVFKKYDITTPDGQALAEKYMIFASPGIMINGELWATGGFDKDKFTSKLKELS